ncbi:MAG: SDR family oxidoreductase, partial [Phycisphaerae bacterium]|nr:SDR family oxidoreductase [Phycisphaerae bacterium]
MEHTKVALVTGAGSGIGRCVAEQLAHAGWRLALVGRREATLEATAAVIGERSADAPELLITPADVADAAQARSAVEIAHTQWGRLDALVNCAGVAPLASIDETDEDLLYQTFAVNTFGPAVTIARAWPIFREQGSGCIVNVSSLASVDPFPGFFVYAASKSAVESLTRSAVREGAEFGVRAFSVAFGAVETPMLRALFSPRELPASKTMTAAAAAHVVTDCVLG